MVGKVVELESGDTAVVVLTEYDIVWKARIGQRQVDIANARTVCVMWWRLPRWCSGKESAGDAGEKGSIHASGGAPGGGNGNPFQYSCLKNPLDRGAW